MPPSLGAGPTGVTEDRLAGALAVAASLKASAHQSALSTWFLGRVANALLKCSFADGVDVAPVWHTLTVSTGALCAQLGADGPRLAPLLATHLDYTQVRCRVLSCLAVRVLVPGRRCARATRSGLCASVPI